MGKCADFPDTFTFTEGKQGYAAQQQKQQENSQRKVHNQQFRKEWFTIWYEKCGKKFGFVVTADFIVMWYNEQIKDGQPGKSVKHT